MKEASITKRKYTTQLALAGYLLVTFFCNDCNLTLFLQGQRIITSVTFTVFRWLKSIKTKEKMFFYDDIKHKYFS